MTRSKGEEKAWKILQYMDKDKVCRNSGVTYEEKKKLYKLIALGQDFSISPEEKKIINLTKEGDIFLSKLAYFFTLSVPWYMISSKDIRATGRLVKPEGLPGGDTFFKGSHTLPLDAVAKRYGNNKEGFIEKSKLYGGMPVKFGDIAFELKPMPRILTTIIIWLEDEEFPPRIDMLFDSSAEFQAPLDILWSLAMMTVLLYL